MIVLFLMSIFDLFHVTSLINWFTALFLMMCLQLNIHCMQIWYWFCCRLIRFYHMLLNNFKLTLLFAFNLCSVIWLFVYIQISLFSDAFLLHIVIASLITCNFAFVMIISSIMQSTTRFICTRCWLRIFCKLCLSKKLNNLININKAVTALYSCVELIHSWKVRQ